ncbi:MAG: hypothetical protein VW362_05845 [Candidatus Nanopelagicales bacterium]
MQGKGQMMLDSATPPGDAPTTRKRLFSGLVAMLAITLAFTAGVALTRGTASMPAAAESATEPQAITPPGPDGFGVFYVNGEQHKSNWSDNRDAPKGFPTSKRTSTYYQARITYLRPENPTGPNIVLVPGYGLASDIWMTTPDLREGWAQMLYHAGYSVYVLSPPDRGESMPIDQINKCKFLATDPDVSPRKFQRYFAKHCVGQEMDAYYGQVGRATLENSWPTWRFGPTYGIPYPNSQFPSLPLKQNYVEQFGASFGPYLGTSDIAMVNNKIMNNLTTDSLEALLAKIGPSVVVLHSAAGTGGYNTAMADSSMVKALVAIETTKCPTHNDAVELLAGTPFLGIWGDHITRESPGGHWDRRAACQTMAKKIRAIGEAPAKVITLPNIGIHGNSHMMMEDLNNDRVLMVITDWLSANGI